MQSVPVNRYVPKPKPRSQEMQPIASLHSERDAEEGSSGSSSRFRRTGSITANYYGDESVNEISPATEQRRSSNQSFTRSIQTAVGNKNAHQSRRLPYWIWFILAKSLGIKLGPNDKPIFGTLMHVLTLTFAMGFAVTFTWHKVYDIVSEYTKETVLKGAVAILLTIYWCSLGVYANQLATKLFRNPKFLDSVRLHTKTIFKVSAAGIMVCLGITVVTLHCIDTVDTYRPHYCHKVRVSQLVCQVMYVMRIGCVWISLLWNLLVGIVLLSVCRTHTIGIRRFIRELEIDGKLYELRLRQQNPGQELVEDPHLQHEALWDDNLADHGDLFENISVTEILTDSSTGRQSPSTSGLSRSCPTSPIMVRSRRNLAEDAGATAVSFSLPPHHHSDDNAYSLESFDERHTRNRSAGEAGNVSPERRNPFNLIDDSLVDTAVRDHFTSDEVAAEPVNNVLLLEENYYEREERPLMNEGDEGNINNNGNKEQRTGASADRDNQSEKLETHETKESATWKMLSVDDIYLSYWKISSRLRFTSVALQRWLIAFLMYIILWSFTYIIYWVKHEANMMDIALFLIPILILPIICSAYGEVNYEGKRMLRCICPTAERTEMLQTLFQQPLELNAFGFAISYQVIGGALGALAIAFCTRLVLDEISS